MGQYLIDNNAITNFFSGLFSEKGIDFMAEFLDQPPTISVITEIIIIIYTVISNILASRLATG